MTVINFIYTFEIKKNWVFLCYEMFILISIDSSLL